MEKEISHSRPSVYPAHIESVVGVMQSNLLAEGAKCAEFSSAISKYFDGGEVRLTNSGSAALYFALRLLDVNKGDEVILPTYVCSDVMQVVFATGATPVLCDVTDNWNADAVTIKKKISANTRAIIVTHNLGIQAEVGKVKELGIPVIEDCCQCVGESVSGNRAGLQGELNVLSFQPTKALTTGEGGALVINDKKLANHKDFYRLAHIFRISDMQGALGLAQWRDYPDFLKQRREMADVYFDLLPEELTSRFRSVYQNTTFFRFLLFGITDFEDFRKYMQAGKVHVRKGIDDLLHRSIPNAGDEEYPNAVKMFNGTVSLPLYPTLSKKDVTYISELVLKYWNERN